MSKKRTVLFVDDEPVILQMLEKMMSKYADELDCVFVQSASKALVRLRRDRHYDAMVTDMRMPVMDGATLVRTVSKKWPKTARIILSAHSELEATLRGMPIAHQFLTKPIRPAAIHEALTRAWAVQTVLSDDYIRAVIGRVKELPPRPAVFAKLCVALDNPFCGLDEVTRIIERDAAVTAKILRVMNSAYFARRREITELQVAVSLLGANPIKNLVLGVQVFESFAKAEEIPGFSLDKLQEHAFLTGSIARRISRPESADEAFLAGMLHDVGQLMLAWRQPAKYAEVVADAQSSDRAVEVVEYEKLGVSHAEVGAYLMAVWGLPYSVIEAVANHHAPTRAVAASFDTTAAVYVANHLASECIAEESATGRFVNLDLEYLRLDLDMDYLERIGVAHKLGEWRDIAAALAGREIDAEEPPPKSRRKK